MVAPTGIRRRLSPSASRQLVQKGYKVVVEAGAGDQTPPPRAVPFILGAGNLGRQTTLAYLSPRTFKFPTYF